MKKLLSIILAIVMMFGLIQASALAHDDTTVATLTTADGKVIEYDDIQLCFADTPLYLGCTIVLHKDVTLPDGERLHDSFNDYVNYTVDFNGYTVTGNHSSILRIGSSSNQCNVILKDSVGTGGITNLKESSNSRVIVSTSSVTFEGGNYKSINGVVYKTTATDNFTPITAQTIINGGTFETGGSNSLELTCEHIIINGGIFTGHVKYTNDFDLSHTDSSGEIYGGEFHKGFSSNTSIGCYLNDLIADGYGAFDENGNERIFTELTHSTQEYCLVKESSNPEKDYVAKVVYDDGTEKSFISFEEAVTELLKKRYIDYKWHQDNTLVLLKDIVIDETINRNSVGHLSTKYNIDLNGHTLQNKADTPMSILEIDEFSTVVIKDSVGTGKIICNSQKEKYSTINNHGTLIVDGATIENYSNGVSTCCIYSDGKLEIKNAVITNYSENGFAVRNGYGISSLGQTTTYGECIIYDGTFTGKYSLHAVGETTLYGGAYNGTLLANNALDIIAEGYGYFDENGESNIVLDTNNQITDTKFTVKNVYPVSVTNPNGVTEYYGSLDFAYSASSYDSLIKLLALVVESGDLPIDFKTTIDLNGKTLNTENGVTVGENGDLVITDSQENGQINGGVTVNGGTLDVQAGTINSNANGVTNANGNVTISGGEINGADGYSDIAVSGDNTTTIKGGSYPDGFSMSGATINDTLDGNYAFYDEDIVVVEVGNNQMTISGNVVVYEKSIISAMSSQIRFGLNEDNSFAGSIDIRTRAKISDSDFKKYIADTNDEAEMKIKAAGFVYTTSDKTFDIDVAKSVARGEKVEGYVDAPVNYIQDCDGYYMFTCLVKNIPEEDLSMGIHSYAYICVNDIWYFFPTITTTEFNDLYSKYYPVVAEQYGWTVE